MANRRATSKKITPVIIRVQKGKGKGDHLYDLEAIFPSIVGTNNPNTMTCYCALGQHSSCSSDYAGRMTRPANAEQTRRMLAELRRVGYTDLKVVSRPSSHHAAERRRQIAR